MDPIYYHIPLILALISLVYSGTRYESFSEILIEALRWGLRMIGFLLGIGLLLFVLSQMTPSMRGYFG